MPHKPKHPCAYPGCAELVEAGERYCEAHRAKVNRDYDRFTRTDEVKRRYWTYSWQKLRRRFIQNHPLCEQCLKEGRVTEATEVHHKIPLAEGGTNSEENLMALCKGCHSRMHLKMRNTPRGY